MGKNCVVSHLYYTAQGSSGQADSKKEERELTQGIRERMSIYLSSIFWSLSLSRLRISIVAMTQLYRVVRDSPQ